MKFDGQSDCEIFHNLHSLHGLEGEDPGGPDAGVALEKVPHQARAQLWTMGKHQH